LFFAISSVTGEGVPELLAAIVGELDRIRTTQRMCNCVESMKSALELCDFASGGMFLTG